MYWRAGASCAAATRRGRAGVQKGSSRFPAGNKVADALYKLAVTYGRMGDADRAARHATVDREFPDSEAARRIRGERE